MSQVVVVLGMHRSGTSAVTAGLRLFDVDIGHDDEIMGGGMGNPRGFFENLAIVSFHEEILGALGLFWHSTDPLPPAWHHLPQVKRKRREIRDYIHKRFGSVPLWGFKDPRACRLLPLWKELLWEMRMAPRYLVIVRNPWSVTYSLKARANTFPFPLESGLRLWWEYMRSAIRDTSYSLRHVIDYDLMLEQPEYQLQRLGDRLMLRLNASPAEVRAYTTEFLDPQLRHHQVSIPAPRSPFDRIICEAYALLQDAAQDRVSNEQLSRAMAELENAWILIQDM